MRDMNLQAFVPKSPSKFCRLSFSMASSTSDDEVEMMEVVPDGPDSRVDVCELFSRPRLVPRCGAFGLLGGASFDFKDDSEMDLGTVNGRAEVWQHLETKEPEVAVLSPPCTLFSALMRLWCRNSMGEVKFQSRRLVAERLLLFAVEIAYFQIRMGRYFLFEHPDTADSWQMAGLQDLCHMPGVSVNRFDQCRFGLRAPGTGEPIRKRTRIVHNIPSMNASFQNVFCQCEVPHRRIEGSEAGISLSSYCETYPPELCDAFLRGICREIGAECLQ